MATVGKKRVWSAWATNKSNKSNISICSSDYSKYGYIRVSIHGRLLMGLIKLWKRRWCKKRKNIYIVFGWWDLTSHFLFLFFKFDIVVQLLAYVAWKMILYYSIWHISFFHLKDNGRYQIDQTERLKTKFKYDIKDKTNFVIYPKSFCISSIDLYICTYTIEKSHFAWPIHNMI